MVYNLAQFKLRQTLKINGETLPNQLNKPYTPMDFQIMEGILKSIRIKRQPQSKECSQTSMSSEKRLFVYLGIPFLECMA